MDEIDNDDELRSADLVRCQQFVTVIGAVWPVDGAGIRDWPAGTSGASSSSTDTGAPEPGLLRTS
jgi:hypothetical protein